MGPHSDDTRDKLTFFFDFISPYAFLAWAQIHAIAERNRRPLEVVPVLFAGLLDAHGQKGPAEIPAKRIYTFKDAFRKAHRLGLALKLPPSHPFNPLLALRVASSLSVSAAAKRRLIDELYASTWLRGEGVDSEESVIEAAQRAGFDDAGARALVDEARTPETKARLRAATEDAVRRGVFGVPTTLVDGETFWGTDSLDLLDAFLRGEDPLANQLFADIPITATRRILR